LTFALCVLVIGGVLIITFGDQLITAMGAFLGFAGSVETLWRAFHYMIGLLMLIVGTGLIYYLGPNCKTRLALDHAGQLVRRHGIHRRLVSLFSVYTVRAELLRGVRQPGGVHHLDAVAIFDGFDHIPGRRNQFRGQEAFGKAAAKGVISTAISTSFAIR
jgi:hypothetical protein